MGFLNWFSALKKYSFVDVNICGILTSVLLCLLLLYIYIRVYFIACPLLQKGKQKASKQTNKQISQTRPKQKTNKQKTHTHTHTHTHKRQTKQKPTKLILTTLYVSVIDN